MFSILYRTNFISRVTFILSSAYAFELGQVQSFIVWWRINSGFIPNTYCSLSKLQAFAGYKINMTENFNLFWERWKTFWDREKMLNNSIFSFSRNIFKSLYRGHENLGVFGNMLNHFWNIQVHAMICASLKLTNFCSLFQIPCLCWSTRYRYRKKHSEFRIWK